MSFVSKLYFSQSEIFGSGVEEVMNSAAAVRFHSEHIEEYIIITVCCRNMILRRVRNESLKITSSTPLPFFILTK